MTSGSDDALATHELDLVTRAAKGDTDAFDRFYERNAPGVQLLVERLLGAGATADTVVLEAFEKTVRRLPLLGARKSSPAPLHPHDGPQAPYAALGRERPEPADAPTRAMLSLPSRQRDCSPCASSGSARPSARRSPESERAEVGVQIARARLRLTDALEDASLSGVFAEPRAERLSPPRSCARTVPRSLPSSSRRSPSWPTPTPALPQHSQPFARRRGPSASSPPRPARAAWRRSRATAP